MYTSQYVTDSARINSNSSAKLVFCVKSLGFSCLNITFLTEFMHEIFFICLIMFGLCPELCSKPSAF